LLKGLRKQEDASACFTEVTFEPLGSACPIEVGDSPYGVAVNPVTNRIYVAEGGSSTVSVIDGARNAVVTAIPLDSWPLGAAVNPETNREYVGHAVDNTVSVIEDPGPEVYVLLVNGIAPGGNGREGVINDIDHLKAAFSVEERRSNIATLGGSSGPDSPANPSALDGAIAETFGPSGSEDLCIFYLGTHGAQEADTNGDEIDGFDGKFQIGSFSRLDDNMDTPFEARLAAGDCGAGMILVFMACHSGELVDGANDFDLPAPNVIMTSCTSTQVSHACLVGHAHSCYGGSGLVRGLTSVDGSAPARADVGGMDVTAAELYSYATINDADAGADPQSTAPGSSLQGLTYIAPAIHNSPLEQLDEDYCDCVVPLEPVSVGGIAELPDVAQGGGSSPFAGIALALGTAAGIAALVSGGWYARRRSVR
jgi:YVTN family beta-propeller protein